jgi:hypothetical protein
MRLLKWGLWGALGLFLAMQVIRPERSNPPVEPAETILARAEIPADVELILRRACFDCHSHTSRWPWYSQVAPVSWWLADHVRHARGAMNLSQWPDPASAAGRMAAAYTLQEMCEEVEKGAMPLPSYRLLHPGARLTKDEVKALCRWTRAEAARLGGG